MSPHERPVILYIEDDPASQNLVRRMLEFAGYEVLTALTGLAGIDLARQRSPNLILMDLNLPDLSGREVTTRLRSIGGFDDLPIVALTAQDQSGEREKAFAAGLSGYITKPIDVLTLPEQIAEYLHGRRDTPDPVLLAQAATEYSREVAERLEGTIRELQQAYEELERLDKMKDAFIQLTAHELRTPLTLVYGYGKLLHDSPVVGRMMLQDPEVKGLMINLLEAVERMAAVINEILLVGRVASSRVEVSTALCDLSEIVEAVVQGYQTASAQRRLTLEVDTSAAPKRLYADPDLLALALDNLLSNAIKYTPDGGTITLHMKQVGEEVQIVVQDTGIGISKDDQALIFERFYTAGDTQLHSTSKTAFRGGGLGLGLAICRGIIEAHDGRIWVESPGRDEQQMPGSRFTIRLPIKRSVTRPLSPPSLMVE